MGQNGDKITVHCSLYVQLFSVFVVLFFFSFSKDSMECERVGFSAGVGRLSH